MALGPMPMGVPGGGLPPGGGMPQPMQAPQGNLGPHTIPQSNPGNIMQAAKLVVGAAQALQQALPMIPMGTEAHQKLFKATSDLNKIVTEFKDTVSKLQGVAQMYAQARQGQPHAALQALSPQQNQAPAMPPPGGAAPPA